MNRLRMQFRNSEEYGYVEFDAKHDIKYYKKYKMDSSHLIGCSSDVCITKFRYINWSDKTDLVRAGSQGIGSLSHKRKWDYRHPRGFDHTSFWRKKGDQFPLLCITEPYDKLTDEEQMELDDIFIQYNLLYKLYDKSDKSLWYPNRTYMYFIWNPHYFDFDKHESILLSHENNSDFIKRCEVTSKKRMKLREAYISANTDPGQREALGD